MKASPSSRVVAIVGRPNVGKSALFNRLVGRRLSIVHEESGVTRDRVCSEVTWDEHRFDLIDTAGLGRMDEAMPEHVIDQDITDQIDAAIEDAAVLVLVVDITRGALPLDREVARLLHRSGRRVFVAANKADHDRLDKQTADFAELGFPVFPVSALHNRGIGDLVDAIIPLLPETTAPSVQDPLKVAIVGRPNVGKSSYINRILRHNRVIVSDVPGTTRDSIEVPFSVGQGPQARHYLLIDTAGLRKRSKAHGAVEKFSMIRTERSIEQSDLSILVLDAEQGPSRQDKKIGALIAENQKGCLVLINKWDLSTVTQRVYGKALHDALPQFKHVPVIFASSKSGYNIRKSIEGIDLVAAHIQTVLTTGVLNRILRDAFTRVPPPLSEKNRLKLFYATQVGIKPVRLRLFVNNPKLISSTYKIYLFNTLYQAFGLEGAPVKLYFSGRDTKNAKR